MIAVGRVCAYCGGPFDRANQRRADTEFCSPAHRQASYRERRALQPLDPEREQLADVVWRLRVRGEIDGAEALILLVCPPAEVLERLRAA